MGVEITGTQGGEAGVRITGSGGSINSSGGIRVYGEGEQSFLARPDTPGGGYSYGPLRVEMGYQLDGVAEPFRAGLQVYYPNGQVMARLGELPGSGRVGLEICDENGVVKALAGELTDGDYGLAVTGPSGELTKLSDFVFGPRVDRVRNVEARTSTSWGDLTTVGPEVEVKIGESGVALVLLTTAFDYNGNNSQGGGLMGVELSGANSQTPEDFYAVVSTFSGAGSWIVGDRKTAQVLLTGLNPGNTTFKAKYRKHSGTTLQFFDREIAVFPY
ncbi:hypothetical protein O7628_11225 [Micromonospora sp. WMMD956]|uniref:hypothetical protein n=1 Tax=Micromonospora sp. WMMD956 TaxID=3016108 RepID=UPI002415D4F5|nr:hypothetical protein [Micromonospora sp. WMMD956]MDG4816073.1 hypothetical protein [Micromonospora sp. WMMD956]